MASVTEMLGIGMILPLFSIVSGGEVGGDKFSLIIAQALSFVGLEPSLQILLGVMVVVFILKAILLLLSSIVELWTTTKIGRDLQINLARLIENAQFSSHGKSGEQYQFAITRM